MLDDVVKTSLGSTEENSCLNRKIFFSSGGSGDLLEVHVKK